MSYQRGAAGCSPQGPWPHAKSATAGAELTEWNHLWKLLPSSAAAADFNCRLIPELQFTFDAFPSLSLPETHSSAFKSSSEPRLSILSNRSLQAAGTKDMDLGMETRNTQRCVNFVFLFAKKKRIRQEIIA